MKRSIPSIPQLYRNVRRWTEILSVLSKYGLADWLSRLNIDILKDQLKSSSGGSLARESHHTRIRLALNELGPTFIKLGQLLSTRPDLIGGDLATELQKLQTQVTPDDFEYIRATVETELGQPLEILFDAFDEEPIASASIGQVHRAKLADGGEVVVKVQHKGIERVVNTDLDILAGLAQLAERVDEFKPYRPEAVVADLARTMRREIEFGREERNLLQFAAMFEGEPHIRIPHPVEAFSTTRVLTMERLDGVKVSDIGLLQQSGADLEEIARRLAEAYLRMIFQEGFFHADPHPGNILVVRGNIVGLLDFGMVGRISERMREDIEEMLLAIISKDVPILSALIRRLGAIPPDLNEGAFANDLAEFVGTYATTSLERFNLGHALADMMSMIRRHRITLPSEVAMLIKVLITLEGTGRLLSPKLSLMELMRPFRQNLLLRRLSPTRHAKKVRRIMLQLEQLAEDLPHRLATILEQIQLGKFDVHLDHRRLGPSVNRLVMGLMTSALFLGSSVMLSMKVPPLLFPDEGPWGIQDLSILGLLGILASMAMGGRLTLAIRKSGNLDRQS
jgi:ubiquinone biosynthesis protein